VPPDPGLGAAEPDPNTGAGGSAAMSRPVRMWPVAAIIAVVGIVVLPLYAASMANLLGLGEAWSAFCAAVGIPPGD